MANTSPDNILTPDAGDQYALVQDLGLLADSVQDALTRRANSFQGTSASRVAFTATATTGMLWQDTDGIGMIWKKVGVSWVPAVWRWAGSTAQMGTFPAPNGFEWRDNVNGVDYSRIGGAWLESHPSVAYSLSSGALNSSSWTVMNSAASWSPSGSTFTWNNGVVIPRAGMYEVSINGQVSTNLSIFFALKLNDLTLSRNGVVVMNASTGFSLETAGGGSRTMTLAAGDVITPAFYTTGAAGPYGMTPSGTGMSVVHVR